MKKVYFKTFGCRTNLYDSQVMIGALKEYEVTQNEDEADAIVINSCTVTNGADTHVRTYISHIEKTSKDVELIQKVRAYFLQVVYTVYLGKVKS